MIVPDLSKTLKPSREDVESPAPTPEPTPTGTTRLVPVNASEFGRRRKRFDRSSAFSLFSASPGRSIPATSSAKLGLAERQTCASGLTYYACANGFTGCCQGNPCTQTAQCSVEEPTTSNGSSTTQSRTSTAQSSRSATSGTRTATGTATRSGTSSAGITTATDLASGTTTSSGAATTIASATATPAPTCPGAPSNFNDNLGIAYQVKCNIDNGGSYNETIKVNAGGYAQCCSACSSSSQCVGFTFFGDNGNSTTAGTCYVRSSMSASEDFNSDSYAVTLYKVDPSAVATTPVPSSSASAAANSSNKSNTGAIAGGVVGGVAAVVLLLALFAFFVRRHRKKVDARHAAEKTTPLPTRNPAAAERYSDRIAGGHQHRSGSTANDIYTPHGGFHDHQYSTPSTTDEYALAAVPATNKKADHFSELEGHSSTPPGLRAEGGRSMIPAGVLRPPQMLDSRSVGGGVAAASRSSVFLEHMFEMEDTSYGGGGRQTMSITSPYSSKAGESPTLGNPSGSTTSLADETRRRQHLLYWNNYDSGQLNDQEGRGGGQMSATLMPKTPPSARLTPGTAQISPDNTGSGGTHESGFVVSPLNVRKSERGGSPSSQNDQPPRRGTS